MSRRFLAVLVLAIVAACEPPAPPVIEVQPQPAGWLRHEVRDPAFSIAAPAAWEREPPEIGVTSALRLMTEGHLALVVGAVEGAPADDRDATWSAWLEDEVLDFGPDLGWVETSAGRARHAGRPFADAYFLRHPDGGVLWLTFTKEEGQPNLALNRAVVDTLRFNPAN